MLAYMLDTNICIYVIKNRPPAVREKFNAVSGALSISSITLAELHYGAEKSAHRLQNLQAVAAFIAQLVVLEFGAKAAAHHGQLRVELEHAGQLCGPYDMLIGAHARSEGLTVVTNNLRELARMPGLRTENWV